MQAEIKFLHSPDIDDLVNYSPKDKQNFSFLLELMLGKVDEKGEESFDMIVCTPDWLKEHHNKNDILFGRHYLIVFEYNYQAIFDKLNQYVNSIEAKNWDEIGLKAGRIGHWEFEDYKP